jgi:hypothetical protein
MQSSTTKQVGARSSSAVTLNVNKNDVFQGKGELEKNDVT